jgi:hypothetical protein
MTLGSTVAPMPRRRWSCARVGLDHHVPQPGQRRRERGAQHVGHLGPAEALPLPGEVVVVGHGRDPGLGQQLRQGHPERDVHRQAQRVLDDQHVHLEVAHEPVQRGLQLAGAVPQGPGRRRRRRSLPEQLGLQGADRRVPEVGGRMEQARPEPVAELAGEPDDLVALVLEDRAQLVRLQAHPVQPSEARPDHPDDHVLPPVGPIP